MRNTPGRDNVQRGVRVTEGDNNEPTRKHAVDGIGAAGGGLGHKTVELEVGARQVRALLAFQRR